MHQPNCETYSFAVPRTVNLTGKKKHCYMVNIRFIFNDHGYQYKPKPTLKACEPKGISEALHVTMWIISSQWSCNFLNLQMGPLTYVPDTLKITSQCPPFHKSDTPISNNKYDEIKCLLNRWVELDGVVMTVNRQWAGWSRIQFLSVTRNFSLLHNVKTSSGAHPASYSMGIGGILHEGIGAGA